LPSLSGQVEVLALSEYDGRAGSTGSSSDRSETITHTIQGKCSRSVGARCRDSVTGSRPSTVRRGHFGGTVGVRNRRGFVGVWEVADNGFADLVFLPDEAMCRFVRGSMEGPSNPTRLPLEAFVDTCKESKIGATT